VSAAESPGAGLELCRSTADIVELACHRGRERDLAAVAAGRGLALPVFGRTASNDAGIAACVRPGRWLLLQPMRAGAPAANDWQGAIGDLGSAVDLSAALALLLLRGSAARTFLSRHCRLDLRRAAFAAGRAAASTMAQVPIIIMARSRGLLLATPATTARHFGEWLEAAGRLHGLEAARPMPAAELLGDQDR
jgi:heterotetrameric sarcosine oxidase gamma subunit